MDKLLKIGAGHGRDSLFFSFLHLPKSEFPLALENMRAVLQPAGLFYLGLYGDFDFEGIWDDDSYTPKRFFSLHNDEDLSKLLTDVFEILYFRNVNLDDKERQFQSVILRKVECINKRADGVIRSKITENWYYLPSQRLIQPIQKALLLWSDGRPK